MSVVFNEPGGGQTPSNPSQQNNVFQFVQTTKPTERSAGVALVAGDRWYKPTAGTSWFWNGTYWLSVETHFAETPLVGMTGTSSAFHNSNGLPINSFINEIRLAWNGGGQNASNYYVIQLNYRNLGSTTYSIGTTFNTSTYAGNDKDSKIVNTRIINHNNYGDATLATAWTAVGSPAAGIFKIYVFYRLVNLD